MIVKAVLHMRLSHSKVDFVAVNSDRWPDRKFKHFCENHYQNLFPFVVNVKEKINYVYLDGRK